MAHRNPLVFTDEDQQRLADERFTHPHERGRQWMEYLWLRSQGESQQRSASLAGVSRTTGWRLEKTYRTGGVDAVATVKWEGTSSELDAYRSMLAAEFEARPPHTVDEAAERIEQLTGLRRRPTAVRQFLCSLGFRWRRVAALPTPPKKTSPSTPVIRPSLCAMNCNPA